jgi:hypothetical protein
LIELNKVDPNLLEQLHYYYKENVSPDSRIDEEDIPG